MHIVVFEHDFYPNLSGSSLVRWRFCQIAVERGHEVTVFTHRTGDHPRSEVVDGVRILRPVGLKPASLPGTTPIAILLELLSTIVLLPVAAVWLARNDVDALHATAHDMFWLAKLLSVLFRIPNVSFVGYTNLLRSDGGHFVESVFEYLNFRLFMGNAVFSRVPDVADDIDEIAHADVNEIHGVVNKPRVLEAVEANDPESVRDRWGVTADETLLVFVGRLVQKKNPLACVEILTDLPDSYKLVVVGDGMLKEDLEAEIDRYDLENRVFLTERLPHLETLQILHTADAILLTSHVEAYPTVAFEGLTLGNTIFATNVGILPEIDHPDLVLGTTAELADLILSTPIMDSRSIDQKSLDEYAVEVYADTILGELERISAD